MPTILVVDTVGDSRQVVQAALLAAGWEVKVLDDPVECCASPADAVVLAADAAGLAHVQQAAARLRAERGTPVLLIADLDRSGWDRTFGASGGLAVEALLDTPVNPQALVARLRAIFTAREEARQLVASSDMQAILDRATENEEASIAFYRRAAQHVSDPETREALELLARDEHEHKQALDEFKAGRRPLPPGSPAAGSLAQTFGTPEFSVEMPPADAFLLAANKERLATQMYQSWAALYDEGPERELLLRLADMERQHLARVEAMFSNAAFPEAW